MLVSMTDTRWWKYVKRLLGDDTFKAAATKAGFNQSAFSRWSRGAAADPAFVVKLARAYDANVLEALVEAEFLTEEEAGFDAKSPRFDFVDLRGVRMIAKKIDDQQKALQREIQKAFPPQLMNHLAEMQQVIDGLSEEEKEAVKRNELDFDSPEALEKWRREHPKDEKAGNVVDLHPDTPRSFAVEQGESGETTPSVRGDWDGEMPADAVADSSPEEGGTPDDYES